MLILQASISRGMAWQTGGVIDGVHSLISSCKGTAESEGRRSQTLVQINCFVYSTHLLLRGHFKRANKWIKRHVFKDPLPVTSNCSLWAVSSDPRQLNGLCERAEPTQIGPRDSYLSVWRHWQIRPPGSAPLACHSPLFTVELLIRPTH